MSPQNQMGAVAPVDTDVDVALVGKARAFGWQAWNEPAKDISFDPLAAISSCC